MKKLMFALITALAMTGSAAKAREVVVAVIDTGLNPQEKRFSENLWTNPGETGLDALGRDKATNGIDDDGNGFVDDLHGWNFVSQSHDLRDRHGHGTHIAGIILRGTEAIEDRKVRLMILKYYERGRGLDPVTASREALRYAIRQNVDLINYSGGGPQADPEEKKLLEEAERKGILVIAAAGNEGSNTGLRPYFPASYGFSNILSVAATDGSEDLIPTSNYGSQVDVAAPGLGIWSNLPDGGWGRMSGTSQATAFVSSVATRLIERQRLPAALLKEKILKETDVSPVLEGKVRSRGTLRIAQPTSDGSRI